VSARRIAVMLFNLGGPDGPPAVRPFLFNLFNDKAIIGAPQPVRWLLAQLISRTREDLAKANYALMGGGSPIVAETERQARALEQALAELGLNAEFKCFAAMRYWRPFAAEAVRAAESWGADEAVLLPLYPQYSTTTTASSLAAWRRAAPGMKARGICCYPAGEAFVAAHVDAIFAAWRAGGAPEKPRVLFSAHGLPQRVIDAGDPYQWQVEQSCAAVRARLPPDWESRICYQSRVGPLAWIGPSTEAEIEAAAHDNVGVIVAPIAFVSEHVETLVELDIEYAEKARALALPFYLRAPALGPATGFIETLAGLVVRAMSAEAPLQSESGGRICPAKFGRCPLALAAR
jgi:protoporphyrin/coproporphyrin ferrochelatase